MCGKASLDWVPFSLAFFRDLPFFDTYSTASVPPSLLVSLSGSEEEDVAPYEFLNE